jgi:hypothetical protein
MLGTHKKRGGPKPSPFLVFGYLVAYKTADFNANWICGGFAVVGLTVAKPFLFERPSAEDHKQARSMEMV